MILDKRTILFIGDSITDCGRNRNDIQCLGNGYVSLIAALYSTRYPDKNNNFINQGISGDRADTLLERLDEDCLIYKPDFVTLLVGINNSIHRFKRGITTSPLEFEASYGKIVEKLLKYNQCRLIMIEPFLLPVNNENKRPDFIRSIDIWDCMREDLEEKIGIVRKSAEKHNITFIPMNEIFVALSSLKPPEYWLSDGIHPTPAGHAVIAEKWLETIANLK